MSTPSSSTGQVAAQCHPVEIANWAVKCSSDISTIKAELTTFDQPCATEDFLNSLKRINDSVHNVECLARSLLNYGSIPNLSVIPVVPGIQTHDKQRTQRAKDYFKLNNWMHNRVYEFAQSVVDGFNKNSIAISSSVESRRSKEYLRQRGAVHNDLRTLMNDVIHRSQAADINMVPLFTSRYTIGLLVRVSSIMNVIIVFRGLLIDHLIIRGVEEPVYKVTCNFAQLNGLPDVKAFKSNEMPPMGEIDLHSPSRHLVYRKLTDFARVIALKGSFSLTSRSAVFLRAFFSWLKQCRNIFSTRCSKCDLYLDSCGVPPFPQMRSNEYLHEFCRS